MRSDLRLMDFAHAVVRRLEERDWCDLGIGLVGYASGATSPKYHGAMGRV